MSEYSEYFVSSNNIEVFPSVNRTFTVSSRLTEERMTNFTYQLIPKNTLNNGFVITTSNNSISDGEFEFNIQGYYFKILNIEDLITWADKSTTALSIWAHIKLNKETSDIGQNLVNTLSTPSPKTLDVNVNLNENSFKFEGVRFVYGDSISEKPSGIENYPAIQILYRNFAESTNWYIPENSKQLIIPGYDINDIGNVLVLDERRKLIWDEATRAYFLDVKDYTSEELAEKIDWNYIYKNYIKSPTIFIGDEIETGDVIEWKATAKEGYIFENDTRTVSGLFTTTKKTHSIILPESSIIKLDVIFQPNSSLYGQVNCSPTIEDGVPYWTKIVQQDLNLELKTKSDGQFSTVSATPATTQTYTISFDANGGIGDVPKNITQTRTCTFTGTWLGYTSPVTTNQTITAKFIPTMSGEVLPTPTLTPPEDMEFDSWCATTTVESYPTYKPGGYITGTELDKDLIMYAIWGEAYKTFTFIITGDEDYIKSKSATREDGKDVLGGDVHTKETIYWTATTNIGYHFKTNSSSIFSTSTVVHNRDESSYHIDLTGQTEVNKYQIDFAPANTNWGYVSPTIVLDVPHFINIEQIDVDKFQCSQTVVVSSIKEPTTINISFTNTKTSITPCIQTHTYSVNGWSPKTLTVSCATTIKALFNNEMSGDKLPNGGEPPEGKEGYVFINWRDSEDNVYLEDSYLETVYNDIELSAYWSNLTSHTIYFSGENCTVHVYGKFHGKNELHNGDTVYETEKIKYYAESTTGYHFGTSNETTRNPQSEEEYFETTVSTSDLYINPTTNPNEVKATANTYKLTINNTNCTVEVKGGDGRTLKDGSVIYYGETVSWTMSYDDNYYELREGTTTGQIEVSNDIVLTFEAIACKVITIYTDDYVTVDKTKIKLPWDKTTTFTISSITETTSAWCSNENVSGISLNKIYNYKVNDVITITPVGKAPQDCRIYINGQCTISYIVYDSCGTWTETYVYAKWNTVATEINTFSVDTNIVKDIIKIEPASTDIGKCRFDCNKEDDETYSTLISNITTDNLLIYVYNYKQTYKSDYGLLPTEVIGYKVPGEYTIEKPSEEYYSEILNNGYWFKNFHYENSDYVLDLVDEYITPESTGPYVWPGVNTYTAMLYPADYISFTVGLSTNPIEFNPGYIFTNATIYDIDTTVSDEFYSFTSDVENNRIYINIDIYNIENGGKIVVEFERNDDYQYGYLIVNVEIQTVEISYVTSYGTAPTTSYVTQYLDYLVKSATTSMKSFAAEAHKHFAYWQYDEIQYNPKQTIYPTGDMELEAIFEDNAEGTCTIISNLYDITPATDSILYYTNETKSDETVQLYALNDKTACDYYTISATSNNSKVTVNYNTTTHQLEINFNNPTVTSTTITISATFKHNTIETNCTEDEPGKITCENEISSFSNKYGEESITFEQDDTNIIYYWVKGGSITGDTGIYFLEDIDGNTTIYRIVNIKKYGNVVLTLSNKLSTGHVQIKSTGLYSTNEFTCSDYDTSIINVYESAEHEYLIKGVDNNAKTTPVTFSRRGYEYITYKVTPYYGILKVGNSVTSGPFPYIIDDDYPIYDSSIISAEVSQNRYKVEITGKSYGTTSYKLKYYSQSESGIILVNNLG